MQSLLCRERATSRPQLLRPEPSCCYGDACKPAVSHNQTPVTCGAHTPTVLRGSLLTAANTLERILKQEAGQWRRCC